MSITKIGKTKGPPSPNIHLGAACGEMISVCLTAPDKSGSLADQTRQILDIAERHLIDAGSARDRSERDRYDADRPDEHDTKTQSGNTVPLAAEQSPGPAKQDEHHERRDGQRGKPTLEHP